MSLVSAGSISPLRSKFNIKQLFRAADLLLNSVFTPWSNSNCNWQQLTADFITTKCWCPSFKTYLQLKWIVFCSLHTSGWYLPHCMRSTEQFSSLVFSASLLFPFSPTCVDRTYSPAGSCQKMTNDEENFLGINLVPAQLGKVEPGPCSVVVNL
jgi:hypothetical protein